MLARGLLVGTALDHGIVFEVLRGISAFIGSVLVEAFAWVVLDCELHFPACVFGCHVRWVAYQWPSLTTGPRAAE